MRRSMSDYKSLQMNTVTPKFENIEIYHDHIEMTFSFSHV